MLEVREDVELVEFGQQLLSFGFELLVELDDSLSVQNADVLWSIPKFTYFRTEAK